MFNNKLILLFAVVDVDVGIVSLINVFDKVVVAVSVYLGE